MCMEFLSGGKGRKLGNQESMHSDWCSIWHPSPHWSPLTLLAIVCLTMASNLFQAAIHQIEVFLPPLLASLEFRFLILLLALAEVSCLPKHFLLFKVD